MTIAQKIVARTIFLAGNINSLGNRKFKYTIAKLYQHIHKYYGKSIIDKTDEESVDQFCLYFTEYYKL